MRGSQYVFWGIRITISAGLVYIVFSRIHIGDIIVLIRSADLFLVISGIVISFIAFAINTKKWQSLLVPIVGSERFSTLLKLNLLGIFYAVFLPGGQLTGEAIKSYHFVKGKDDKERIIFSVVMDRLISLIVFVFFGFISLLLAHPAISQYSALTLLFSALSLGSALLLLLFNRAFFIFLEGLRRRIFRGSRSLFASLVEKVFSVMSVYKGEYQTLRSALFYGALFQIINTVGTYTLAMSVHADVSLLTISWVNTLVSIVVFIPVTFMGLGLREGSYAYFLSLVGISAERAIGISALVFLVSLLLAVIGGFLEYKRVFLKPHAGHHV